MVFFITLWKKMVLRDLKLLRNVALCWTNVFFFSLLDKLLHKENCVKIGISILQTAKNVSNAIFWYKIQNFRKISYTFLAWKFKLWLLWCVALADFQEWVGILKCLKLFQEGCQELVTHRLQVLRFFLIATHLHFMKIASTASRLILLLFCRSSSAFQCYFKS